MMPNNPIVGGTALRRPAITSPNFNLANPTASPSPSWGILESGLAYFFGLVLTGGTITGPDYIINSAGAFFYSSTPALGNLIASIASVAGTDQFGNVYQAGITSNENVFGTSTNIFGSGMQFQFPTSTPVQIAISPNGLLVYKSPGGALGNLIVSLARAAGTDQYGNNFPAGFNCTTGSISGTTFNGTDFILNPSGAFFYSSAPALGDLIASIASVAGTDTFGNAYNAGIWSYSSGGIQSGLQQVAGAASLVLNTGDGSQAAPGQVFSQTLLGPGGGRVLVTNILAPQFPADPGAASVQIRSVSFDGVTIPQQVRLLAGSGSVELVGSATPQFNIDSPGINVPANTVLTAAKSITTTTYSNVGLAATLIASATYLVELELYGVPTGTIGSTHTHGFNYSGTASSDGFAGVAYQATSTSTINQATGHTTTVLNIGNIDVVGSPTHLAFQCWTRIAGYITTSTAGTLNAVVKLGTLADTVQFFPGSFMKVTRIS